MPIDNTKAIGDDKDWKRAAEKKLADQDTAIAVLQQQVRELQQRK